MLRRQLASWLEPVGPGHAARRQGSALTSGRGIAAVRPHSAERETRTTRCRAAFNFARDGRSGTRRAAPALPSFSAQVYIFHVWTTQREIYGGRQRGSSRLARALRGPGSIRRKRRRRRRAQRKRKKRGRVRAVRASQGITGAGRGGKRVHEKKTRGMKWTGNRPGT